MYILESLEILETLTNCSFDPLRFTVLLMPATQLWLVLCCAASSCLSKDWQWSWPRASSTLVTKPAALNVGNSTRKSSKFHSTCSTCYMNGTVQSWVLQPMSTISKGFNSLSQNWWRTCRKLCIRWEKYNVSCTCR